MNTGVRMSQPGTPQLNYMKVFVQRDYSDGTSVKFQTRFPAELEGRVIIKRTQKKNCFYMILRIFRLNEIYLKQQ